MSDCVVRGTVLCVYGVCTVCVAYVWRAACVWWRRRGCVWVVSWVVVCGSLFCCWRWVDEWVVWCGAVRFVCGGCGACVCVCSISTVDHYIILIFKETCPRFSIRHDMQVFYRVATTVAMQCLYFQGFCNSHHAAVRRQFRAQNFAPQTC